MTDHFFSVYTDGQVSNGQCADHGQNGHLIATPQSGRHGERGTGNHVGNDVGVFEGVEIRIEADVDVSILEHFMDFFHNSTYLSVYLSRLQIYETGYPFVQYFLEKLSLMRAMSRKKIANRDATFRPLFASMVRTDTSHLYENAKT